MSSRDTRNVSASVRQRLLNMAHERNIDFGLLLVSYAIERLLYRLASSSHSARFILKGATLLRVWGGDLYRPTRDLDLLATGSPEPARMADVFRDVCLVECQEDGLLFMADTISVEDIREGQNYSGIRVRIRAHLDGARIPVQIDIGFGDVVTPKPLVARFPTMLDMPSVQMRMYSMESVIAEKLHAMVSIGELNSRMKDYLDVYTFSCTRSFDGPALSNAIRSTFERRGADLPADAPDALAEGFAQRDDKRKQWNAFLRRVGVQSAEVRLDVVTARLREFLMPPTVAARNGAEFPLRWTDGHWEDFGT